MNKNCSVLLCPMDRKFSKINSLTAYYINLTNSGQRRTSIELSLKNRGFKFFRINAVDGSISSDVFNTIVHHASSLREAACIASHLNAIETAYENQDEFALILEDDTIFDLWDKREFLWEQEINLLPENFSILQLCVVQDPIALDWLYRQKQYILPLRKRNFWSLGGYVISRPCMKYILDLYKKGDLYDITNFTGRHEAYYVIMHSINQNKDLSEPYILKNPCLSFEGYDSEIHSEHLTRHLTAKAYMHEYAEAVLHNQYRSPFSLTRQWRYLLNDFWFRVLSNTLASVYPFRKT